MEGHEERAQELEYEVADLERQSDAVADEIHEAKADWEHKKRDPSVPGAGTGEDDEGPDPEVTGGGPGGGGSPEVEDEKG